MEFVITLKNARLGKYILINWIVLFANITTQIIIALAAGYEKHRVEFVFIQSIALLFIIFTRFRKFNTTDKKAYTGLIYAVIVLAWIRWKLYWIALLAAFFYVLYIYAVRKFEVFISEEGIDYPAFPRKNIPWNELQNMILKDGILTIDFKNDKLLQNEIEDADFSDEKKLNDFCLEQLRK